MIDVACFLAPWFISLTVIAFGLDYLFRRWDRTPPIDPDVYVIPPSNGWHHLDGEARS